MPQFRFNLDRSKKPEDQFGVVCSVELFAGEFGAKEADAAWQLVERMVVIPGVWTCYLQQGQRCPEQRVIRMTADRRKERVS